MCASSSFVIQPATSMKNNHCVLWSVCFGEKGRMNAVFPSYYLGVFYWRISGKLFFPFLSVFGWDKPSLNADVCYFSTRPKTSGCVELGSLTHQLLTADFSFGHRGSEDYGTCGVMFVSRQRINTIKASGQLTALFRLEQRKCWLWVGFTSPAGASGLEITSVMLQSTERQTAALPAI